MGVVARSELEGVSAGESVVQTNVLLKQKMDPPEE
jgi:hypothetical protein